MPDASFFGSKLEDAVAAGTVPQSRVDDMVLRMLTVMFALNLFDTAADPAARNTSSYARSPEHDALALRLAKESITLLKNEGGLLPIVPASLKTVAVFGDEGTVHGGGSGQVVAPYVIAPVDGINAWLNPGLPPPTCTEENDTDYFQADSPSAAGAGPADCCAQCGRLPSCRAWTFFGGSCYFKPDASGRRAKPGAVSGNCTAAAGAVAVTYYSTQDPAAAVAAAKGADLVVMVVATDSSEGSDRKTLGFPAWMDAMVFNLTAANPATVVVARCPGACTMPWQGAAPAILFELLGGQESGNSIASTLFGENNPSGKLPLTFPNPAPAGQQWPTETWLSPPGGGAVDPTMWPGTDRGSGFPEADYKEGLLMGYRWYDAQAIAPAFPFGHGLSYSTFAYSSLAVAGTVTPAAAATVYATVCNTAGPAGKEVAQLYIGYPAAANEPPKSLKGFQKVALGAGDCGGVGFPIAAKDRAFCAPTSIPPPPPLFFSVPRAHSHSRTRCATPRQYPTQCGRGTWWRSSGRLSRAPTQCGSAPARATFASRARSP
jgi:hypothetical protein